MKEVGIPCLFRYFDEFPQWTKGFAFVDNTGRYKEGSAFVSLVNSQYSIKWYCHGVDSNLDYVWIPDAPVIAELYDL
jgi:hypothetical protein